jgi:hypothetical protein
VLDTIKSIQAIDRKKLSHTEKNLLIAIVIDEKARCFNNEQLGKLIGENKDYVKNLLMRLKRKKYLRTEGKGKNRKIIGNSQLLNKTDMVTSSYQNDQNGNSQLPKKPPTYINNVVVVLLEKYGFDFGPVILEKLSRFSVSDQLRAIESTKAYATSNPARYIERILDNDCKGIKLPDKPIVDKYEAERKKIEQLRAESLTAQNLGFKTAGYAH